MLWTGSVYTLSVVSGRLLEQGKFYAKLGDTLQMLTEAFSTFAMKSQNGQSDTV